MVAQVIPLRRARPNIAVVPAWRLEEAETELAARRSEEQEQADIARPLLRRMELMAQEFGPVAWQTYAAIAAWHRRHGARWTEEDGGSAA